MRSGACESREIDSMKRILIILPAAVLAAPAFAADVIGETAPEPAPVEVVETAGWSGVLVGLQAGYGFGGSGGLESDPDGFFGTTDGDFNDGFVGGAHLGYNWQFGSVIVGGVLDVNYANLGDTQSGFANTNYAIERELDFLASAKLRLGYAFSDRFMAYGTGGLAYGDVDHSFTTGSGAVFTTSGGDDSSLGYTVGAGVAAKVAPRVSLGLEYLYTNLGGNDFTVTGGDFGGTTVRGSDEDFDFHTVQLRMSFHF
jgi:outer membrane immunogenic protein